MAVGDLADVFIKQSGQKRGKLSSPPIIIAYNPAPGTVISPALNGRTRSTTVKDIRLLFAGDSSAAMIREANDKLYMEMSNMTEISSGSNLDGPHERDDNADTKHFSASAEKQQSKF